MQPAYGFASIEHRKWACAADELKANEAREEPEVLPDAGPEVIVRVLLAPCAPDARETWHPVARRAAARRPRRQWLECRAAEVACARSGVGTTGGCADAEARPVSRRRAADIRTPHSAPRRAGEIIRRAEGADRRPRGFSFWTVAIAVSIGARSAHTVAGRRTFAVLDPCASEPRRY